MWNPFKEKAVVEIDYKPKLSPLNELGIVNLTEKFKGEVEQNKIKFPTELGEEHPFDFKTLENLYKKFGFFTCIIDKYVDFIIGPGFFVKSDDARAQEIIEQFMQDVNFDTLLRQWTKEALIKGSGFLEIGGSKKEGVKGLKVLNANYMYVNRDKTGKIEGYNQYTGAFNKFEKNRVIPFNVDQIAHVPFNVTGDCAYGLGIGYPAMQLVDNLLRMQRDEHFIMERKANSPLHAKLGKVDGNVKIIPKEEDVTAFGKTMETMNKKINWATDDLVELKVVDFGNIGEKFSQILEYDLNMLIYAFQIPGVILGMANIPEGLANVQMEAFQRRIQSIQAELEKIIEEKIFKRVLNANGLDVHVEFEWGSPSVLQVEGRMKLIAELIKSPTTSMAMRETLEDEMIRLFDLDADEWEKVKLEAQNREEEERKRLETQPIPIVPGQNVKFPQKVAPKAKQPPQPKPEESYEQQKVAIDINVNKNEKVEREVDMSSINQVLKELKEDRETREERQEKKDEEFKQIIKQVLDKPKEISKEDIMSEVKKELEKEKTESVPKKIKKLFSKRKGLLPAFRISKTESVKSEKMIVKIKRKKKDMNYEYAKSCPHCTESWDSLNDIEEWLGFNYKKYLGQIEIALAAYGFEQLKAVNEIELAAGYLSTDQVVKLRKILDEGFKKGTGMKEMAKQVNKKVVLKDLYRMADGEIKLGASGLPILARSADKRAISVVRTEVTKLANKGAIEFYKQEGVKKTKWVASFGARTCPICEEKNGRIYEIGQEEEIPAHTNCRCTIVAVGELI